MIKKMIRKNTCIFFLLPSLVGFCFFYLVPFVMAFYHTIISNGEVVQFVGASYYVQLLTNDIFQNALKNTGIFMGISIPLSMVIALMIAMGIKILEKKKRLLQCMVLIPMVIPTASIAFFWKSFFAIDGLLNQMLSLGGVTPVEWLNSKYTLGVMIFVFTWKNIGYNTILFTAGLYNIPQSYYESAKIDGATSVQQFKYITWIYLLPTTFLIFIMSIINSFKVFKEIYLIAGAYPHESIYMIQHYMNNMFVSLNYQKLSTVAYVLISFIVVFIGLLFIVQRRKKYEY